MTKIDIVSGFLGAGKTTLIKKLLAEAFPGEKLVLIENEFGEISIDGGFLKDSGVQINEMNSGCICCSLVGDFADALQKVLTQFHPDRILIEPSGVGKLSDVIRAVQGVQSDELVLNGFTTVVDANKCRMYMKNFGEFFNNQVENASAIILSRTEGIRPEKLDAAVALLREKNPTATIVTTPWTELDGKQILETMERRDTLSAELEHLKAEAAEDDDGNAIEVAYDPNGPTAAFVFKTISDQYGKFSMIKVIRGKVTSDMSLYNMTTGNTEKLGRLYTMKGKKAEETKEICCGDIGAIGKMDKVKTGDTLCEPKTYVKFAPLAFAPACYERAISPKTKQEIEKLGTGLNKLNEEDPTFSVTNNAETHQTVISGAGDIQIDVLCSKLKSRFGVDAELDTPRVAYREKIRSTVRKQGRYKKQTGGSGQFGDVHIIFEPQTEQEDMIFEENVFGGSVPKNYFPAVEKGLRESCQHGVLAGYPVVFLKATLVDGSYHPVDSSEIAFKLAANLAFKAALPEAKPVLMEPIGELKVTIPDSYLGDVMGDLNKRRGRVMGMNPTGDGEQVLEAEVPMAEMMSYAIDLRSMTQSRGTFTFNFVRYEDCPAAAQEKAIAEAKALAEAE